MTFKWLSCSYRCILAMLLCLQLYNCISKLAAKKVLKITSNYEVTEHQMPHITVCKQGFRGVDPSNWHGKLDMLQSSMECLSFEQRSTLNRFSICQED